MTRSPGVAPGAREGAWASFLDALPVAMVLTDTNHRIVAANLRACAFLQQGMEELLGRPLAASAATDGAGEVGILHVGPDVAGPGRPATTRFRRPDGSIRTAFVSCTDLVITEDTFLLHAIWPADEAPALMHQAAAGEQMAVRLATDLIARLDGAGTFRYVSPACRSLLGYQEEHLVGQPLARFVHPDDIDEVDTLVHADGQEQGAAVATYRFRCPDGSFRWLETTARRIQAGDPDTGAGVEIVAVSRDVTERVQAQKRERQRTEELDSFAHAVSHDLKAPLTTLDFLIERVDEAIADDDRARAAGIVDQVRDITDSMFGLIEGLLAVASVHADSSREAPVNVRNTVGQVMQEVGGMAAARGVRVTVRGTPVFILHAQPVHVQQVVRNLATNAIRHARRDGRVIIHLSNEVGADGAWLKITVDDDGTGVQAGEEDSIFDLFQRGAAKTGEGTGVGLALVARIARLYEARLSVSSATIGGARFTVQWPVHAVAGLLGGANRVAGDVTAGRSREAPGAH